MSSLNVAIMMRLPSTSCSSRVKSTHCALPPAQQNRVIEQGTSITASCSKALPRLSQAQAQALRSRIPASSSPHNLSLWLLRVSTVPHSVSRPNPSGMSAAVCLNGARNPEAIAPAVCNPLLHHGVQLSAVSPMPNQPPFWYLTIPHGYSEPLNELDAADALNEARHSGQIALAGTGALPFCHLT